MKFDEYYDEIELENIHSLFDFINNFIFRESEFHVSPVSFFCYKMRLEWKKVFKLIPIHMLRMILIPPLIKFQSNHCI